MTQQARSNIKFWSNKLTEILLVVLIIVAFAGYLSERTHRKEDALKFHEAAASAGIGSWRWDVKTDTLCWDDRMFEIFGKDKNTWVPKFAGFEASLDPRDRGRVNSRLFPAASGLSGYRAVYRVVGDDGHINLILAGASKVERNSSLTGICVPLYPQDILDLLEVVDENGTLFDGQISLSGGRMPID